MKKLAMNTTLKKITLSKFYIEQLLPLASGYASAVTAGKEDLYNIKAENF